VDKDARSFTLNLKRGSQGLNLRKLATAPHLAAGSIWGQRHMAELRAGGPSRFDAVVQASRDWGVQGKETSFLVLEEADDYIEAKIEPPQSFPADRLEEYKDELAWEQEDEAEEREDHLEDIYKEWEKQITWWETDWVGKAKKQAKLDAAEERPMPVTQPPELDVVIANGTPSGVQNETDDAEPVPAPPANASLTCWDGTAVFDISQCPAQPVQALQEGAPALEADEEYVIVTGSRAPNPAGELPAEISVKTRAWTPDRPFLKALAELDGADYEREYFAQRDAHGDRPSFYLEVADQLHRSGRPPLNVWANQNCDCALP